MLRAIKKFVFHHTAGSASETIQSVNTDHRDKDWDSGVGVARAKISLLGWYIQYHLFIARDGTATQTRKDSEVGWHAGNYAVNQESLAFCIQGNFDKELPTSAQIATLTELVPKKAAEYKLKSSDFYPHRKFTSTSCYGKNLSDSWITQFMKPITVTILGKTEYDLTQLKDWFAVQGLYNIKFSFVKVDVDPVYKQYVANGDKYIDEVWFDNNLAHLGGKSDIVVWLIKEWFVNFAVAYAKPEQRLGQWRCYVSDGGYENNTTMSQIKIKNAVLRVMAHEICHLIYPACGYEDKTHDLDYSGQQDKLLKDVDFGRFKHFILDPDTEGMRLFKRWNNGIEEKIVYAYIAKLFARGYVYWKAIWGYSEDIPKPVKM